MSISSPRRSALAERLSRSQLPAAGALATREIEAMPLAACLTSNLADQSDQPVSVPASAANDADLQARVQQLEAFNGEVCSAIDNLVSAMLELKQNAAQSAPTVQPAAAAELAALGSRMRELEQQLSLERTLHDLRSVSRSQRKARIAVFVGTTYLGCNVKYAWLGALREAAALDMDVWFLPFDAHQAEQVRSITPNCFPADWNDWSAADVQRALSAAVVVTTDHLLNPNPYAAALLAGARHVQLWHGISIKEIGLRNIHGLKQMNPRLARIMATCGPYASLVGTAATQIDEWQRWFSFEDYAPLGYARNDVLLRTPDARDLLNVDAAALEQMRAARRRGRRVLMYAPTFRDSEGLAWMLAAGLEQFADAVRQRGDLLVVNVHPVEAPQLPRLAPLFEHVLFVTPRTDLYPLLRETDALVTDYSSVMFDYLQLDRPVLLYRPDHERYISRSRQLFDAKLDLLPGPLAGDIGALLTELGQLGRHDHDRHAEARRQLREQLFDHHDGRATERLLAHLAQQVETACARSARLLAD